MAKLTYSGFENVERTFEKLGRETVKRLVNAGTNALVNTTKELIQQNHHIVTGAMERSVQPGQYHETIDGGWQEVYPQGSDSRGVTNTVKAFVINYGAGGNKTAKTGDKFITGSKKKRQEAVIAAMEAENKKILNEVNGGT